MPKHLIDIVPRALKPIIDPRGSEEGPTRFSERVKDAWKASSITNKDAIWQEYITRLNNDQDREDEIATEYVNFKKEQE